MNRKLLFQVDQNAPDELDLNYILHHKQVSAKNRQKFN